MTTSTFPERLIDAKELREVVPYSPVEIWRKEKSGQFPRRIKIGPNRVAWKLSEVLAWVDQRAAERESEPEPEAA
jgi:prophage regulatory protein